MERSIHDKLRDSKSQKYNAVGARVARGGAGDHVWCGQRTFESWTVADLPAYLPRVFPPFSAC